MQGRERPAQPSQVASHEMLSSNLTARTELNRTQRLPAEHEGAWHAGTGEASPDFSGSGPRNGQQALARLLAMVSLCKLQILRVFIVTLQAVGHETASRLWHASWQW